MRRAKGDVRAITELANRVEGKPMQPVDVKDNGLDDLAETLAAARKRVAAGMTRDEIEEKISQLQEQLGRCET
jgi:hypothetical protein